MYGYRIESGKAVIDENEACIAIEDMFTEESGNIDLDTDEDIYFDFIIDGKLYCEEDEDF